MSKRVSPEQRLTRQINALNETLEVAQKSMPPDTRPGSAEAMVSELEAMSQRVKKRQATAPDVCVVALLGPTGSGKSTLFNALCRSDISQTGAQRPTTAKPVSAYLEGTKATGLLDWLKITKRVEIKATGQEEALPPGLVLLDLPDLDSTEKSNREIAERLAGMVDVMVWVLDPQKYADARIHDDFIAPMSRDASVTTVVLTHVDLLQESDRALITNHLRSTLDALDMQEVEVIETCAKSGLGVDELRKKLSDIAEKKIASTQRLSGDLAILGEKMIDTLGLRREAFRIPEVAPTEVVATASDSCGVTAVAEGAGRDYIQRANMWVGFPPLTWLAGLRPWRKAKPVEEPEGDSTGVPLAKSSLPAPTPANRAKLEHASRAYAAQLSKEMGPAWSVAMAELSRAKVDDLGNNIDKALAEVEIPRLEAPLWWKMWRIAQYLGLAALGSALVWIIVAWISAALFTPIPSVSAGPIPVPILLLIIGIVLGIILSILGRVIAKARGRVRQAAVARLLETVIAEVVEQVLIKPLGEMAKNHLYLSELSRALGA